ncbi:uncharacterized protein TNIN_471881 [Trichonephila inaurata madagascariensis]|uniref:Uncharacterized protein n=1 Tax=Trichonephila inaurata madagascariensis TaxID=2747483 RepID=A0A8X6IEG1_9ARAC|nr:uncharacterized protein TNIN_471881 [Trichonephila inaurata madagascariensis]
MGNSLLEIFELLKDKIINLNFINRKLTNSALGKQNLAHQPGTQTGYKNKVYSPVLRMILNKTAEKDEKKEMYKSNIFHFNNKNSEKFDFICLEEVPNQHLPLSESYVCQTTFKSQSFETHSQNAIPPLEYTFYIHGNSNMKNKDLQSRVGSDLTNEVKISFNSERNSNSDINPSNNKRYPWVMRLNLFPKILARPEQQVPCYNDKSKCLPQTLYGPDKNETVLITEHFHKTVKRAAVNENQTIENEPSFVENEPSFVENETSAEENVTIETMTIDNVTIAWDEIDNGTVDIAIAENVTLENVTAANETKHIIYVHGLFEMSRGECRDFPETGLYEYKAAQLAIRHVNDRNLIDGYQLQMYHNDTMVSRKLISPFNSNYTLLVHVTKFELFICESI